MGTWRLRHVHPIIPSASLEPMLFTVREEDPSIGEGVPLSSHSCLRAELAPCLEKAEPSKGRAGIFTLIFDKEDLVLEVSPRQTSDVEKEKPH